MWNVAVFFRRRKWAEVLDWGLEGNKLDDSSLSSFLSSCGLVRGFQAGRHRDPPCLPVSLLTHKV